MLSRLKVFLATREGAWRYRGQMTLVVDGYKHDPRELVDIPEVRALLRDLEAEWPYWAYFFNQMDDSIIQRRAGEGHRHRTPLPPVLM